MQRKNQPDSLNLTTLPRDIFPLIANHLSTYSLRSLLTTCSYFSNHKILHKVLNEKVKRRCFALGSSHTLLLDERGILYGLGNDDKGQLGLDIHLRNQPKRAPRRIPISGEVLAIATGSKHTLVLTQNYFYGFGHNNSSQLGLGEKLHNAILYEPQEIIMQEIPKKIFTSSGSLTSFSMVLCDNNHLYVFGANDKGQLGLGDLLLRDKPSFHPFSLTTNIKDVILGANHTFLITDDGIYGFGGNECGQLGLGSDIKFQVTPTRIPFKKYGLDPRQISVGDYHTLILDKSGKLYGLGANGCNQLAQPLGVFHYEPIFIPMPQNEKVIKIKSRTATNFIWCENNIYAFGDNNHGQLGIGKDWMTIPEPEPFLLSPHEVVDIIPGGNHTIAIGKSELYGFGNNRFAQLGTGEISRDQINPIAIGLFKFLEKIISNEEKESLIEENHSPLFRP